MWENVIGVVNEERGANAGVEALINAPQVGQGRKAAIARRAAAAEAVLATGGFDTAVTDYQSLLTLAKSQGAVGGTNRGACKICGQLGHLTKQCRNQFSKFYQDQAAVAAVAAGAPGEGLDSDNSTLNSLERSSIDSSDLSSSSSEEERRRRKRKDKKRRKERKEKKRRRRTESSKSEGKDEKDKHGHKKKRRRRSRSPSASD